MIDDLLVDTVTFYRDRDDLFTGVALPLGLTLNATYKVPVVVEFQVNAGATSTFLVTGISNGAGKTETVTFSGTIGNKVTLSSFTGLSTIVSQGGNATATTARLRNQSGQPHFTEYIVVANLPARISKNEEGSFTRSLTLRNSSVLVQDEHLCFITYGYNLIKSKDKMLHQDSGDQYMVLAVDDVRSFAEYSHTEVTIGLVNPSLKQ